MDDLIKNCASTKSVQFESGGLTLYVFLLSYFICKYFKAHTSFDHANTNTWSKNRSGIGYKISAGIKYKSSIVFHLGSQ